MLSRRETLVLMVALSAFASSLGGAAVASRSRAGDGQNRHRGAQASARPRPTSRHGDPPALHRRRPAKAKPSPTAIRTVDPGPLASAVAEAAGAWNSAGADVRLE